MIKQVFLAEKMVKKMVWVVNEKELFEVNEKLDIEVKRIGNEKVIIIDNFYKNPEQVRKLALSSAVTYWDQMTHGHPGPRCVLGLDMSSVVNVSNKITEMIYNTQVFDHNVFICNFFMQTGKQPGMSAVPHTDPYYFAAVIYLNTEEECRGGTAFFVNKKSGSQIICGKEGDEMFRKHEEFITSSNDEWEILDIGEMKFNRFVLYRSNIYHAPYIKKEWFNDHYRVNQVLFFSKVLNDNCYIKAIKSPSFNVRNVISESGESINEVEVVISKTSYFTCRDINPQMIDDFIKLATGETTFSQVISLLSSKYPDITQDQLLTFKDIVTTFFQKGVMVSKYPS